VKKLSKPTILFHWLTAILFIGTLVVGKIVENMPRGAEKFELLANHKSFGVIVLVIALARIAWRFKEGALPPLSQAPRWQDIAAKSTHHLLLLATLAMPISGIMMSSGGGRALEVFGFELIAAGDKIEWLQSVGSTVHHSAVNVIILLLLVHLAGAIKHQFIDKDGTISRMLGR
jgi:cytochrome b561